MNLSCVISKTYVLGVVHDKCNFIISYHYKDMTNCVYRIPKTGNWVLRMYQQNRQFTSNFTFTKRFQIFKNPLWCPRHMCAHLKWYLLFKLHLLLNQNAISYYNYNHAVIIKSSLHDIIMSLHNLQSTGVSVSFHLMEHTVGFYFALLTHWACKRHYASVE